MLIVQKFIVTKSLETKVILDHLKLNLLANEVTTKVVHLKNCLKSVAEKSLQSTLNQQLTVYILIKMGLNQLHSNGSNKICRDCNMLEK